MRMFVAFLAAVAFIAILGFAVGYVPNTLFKSESVSTARNVFGVALVVLLFLGPLVGENESVGVASWTLGAVLMTLCWVLSANPFVPSWFTGGWTYIPVGVFFAALVTMTLVFPDNKYITDDLG